MDFTKRSADLIRKFHPLGRRWWTGVLFQGIKQHVTHKMCLEHTYFYQNLVSNNDCSTTILPTQNFSFDLSFNSFWNLVIQILALLWSIFPAHASLFPCFLSHCNSVYIWAPGLTFAIVSKLSTFHAIVSKFEALHYNFLLTSVARGSKRLDWIARQLQLQLLWQLRHWNKNLKSSMTWIRSSNHIHWDRHPRVSFDALRS